MVSKELKKLSRRELVDIIYQMKKNEEQLQEEITSLQKELQDKRIRISMAGSIAEATMSITNVFSAAQMTADLYLHEISCMKADAEKECAQKLEEANEEAKKILLDNENKLAEIKERYQEELKKLEQLREEIKTLEESKNHEVREEIENV